MHIYAVKRMIIQAPEAILECFFCGGDKIVDPDKRYMKRALQLAMRGAGKTDPNPLVGAVIVKNGVVIGEGWHKGYGLPHAERDAIASCTQPTEGATLYVTLEPCCHYGKTPPCTEAILQAGISRVVAAVKDPNPLVAGMGLDILQKHGVDVRVGVLETEALELNAPFFWYIQQKTPYVVLKYAMTLDGKIAAYTGLSQWITSETARKDVHRLRNRYVGIMVGVGTVLADDPMLNCRLAEGGRNPVRIICDTALRTPLDANVVKTAGQIRTILATCQKDAQKQKPYLDSGCEIVVTEKKDGMVDLQSLMSKLGEMGISSILLEGGATLAEAALQAGIVQYLYAYIAPKLFGGKDAKTPIGGKGVAAPSDAWYIEAAKYTHLGKDLLVEGAIKCSQES